MRTIPALVLSAGLVVGLTACSTDALGGCAPAALPGPASELVTASGAFAKAPTVDFPTPLIAHDVEASTLIEGEGDRVSTGDTVLLNFLISEGVSGAELGRSDYSAAPQLATLGSSALASVVSEGLQCQTVGSRVAIVASPERTHQGQTGGSFDANASLVYVIDIVDAFPAKADGAPQVAINGLPAVVTAPDGTPGITVPSKPAPEELTVASLRIGSGEKVAASDTLVVKYTGVLWDDGGVFDSTWSDGTAVEVDLAGSSPLPSVVTERLEGTTVGSQLLVVVPPGDESTPGVPPNSTLVYVIDILGILGD